MQAIIDYTLYVITCIQIFDLNTLTLIERLIQYLQKEYSNYLIYIFAFSVDTFSYFIMLKSKSERHFIYYKFGNFREDFIFAKLRICEVS